MITNFIFFQKKGQLQVSQKERKLDSDNKFKEIALTVANKCINTDTKRPYPVAMIEQAMKDLHFNVHPNRSAKQQVFSSQLLLLFFFVCVCVVCLGARRNFQHLARPPSAFWRREKKNQTRRLVSLSLSLFDRKEKK